jgi:hypothetical protein
LATKKAAAEPLLFLVVRTGSTIEGLRLLERGLIVVSILFEEPHAEIIIIFGKHRLFLGRRRRRGRLQVDGFLVKLLVLFDPIIFQVWQGTGGRAF